MPFIRPTITEIAERVEQDHVSRLELQTPLLRRAMVRVLSRVVAGAAHLLHGFLEFLSRQIFPDLAERAYLLRWGSLFGITLKAAEFASGNVVVVGTNATVIPLASRLTRADGTAYTVDADVTVATLTAWAGTTAYTVGALRRNGGNVYQCITAGTSAGSGGPTTTATDITDGTAHWRYIAAGSAAVLAAVHAELAGQDGNCEIGTAVAFESPIAGANASATFGYGGLASGADEEDIEAYRTRVISRMRAPPHGGNETDYVAWALEVPGVTRAWCYPVEGGAGTVTVRFVRDNDASLIPDAGEVTAVANHIAPLRPVTAVVTVAAPTADALNFTLHIVPDTTATRAAVEAEIRDMILRDSKPGETILLSHIETAIGNAEGITDFAVTLPAADVVHATGHMAVFGAITWA
jgi:uncharacterized phage protein gp47/JayE